MSFSSLCNKGASLGCIKEEVSNLNPNSSWGGGQDRRCDAKIK